MSKVFLYSTSSSSSCELLLLCALRWNIHTRNFQLSWLSLSLSLWLQFFSHPKIFLLKRKREENKNQSRSEIEKVFQWNESRFSSLLLSFDFLPLLPFMWCVYLYKKYFQWNFPASFHSSHHINTAELKLDVKSSRQDFTSSSFHRYFELREFHLKFPLATLLLPSLFFSVVEIDWILTSWKGKQKSSQDFFVVATNQKRKDKGFDLENIS